MVDVAKAPPDRANCSARDRRAVFSVFGRIDLFGRRAESTVFGRRAVRASAFERECIGLDGRSARIVQAEANSHVCVLSILVQAEANSHVCVLSILA